MPQVDRPVLSAAAAAELFGAVQTMRRLQRAWFGGDKSRETLEASKRAERLVDRLIAEAESAQGRLV